MRQSVPFEDDTCIHFAIFSHPGYVSFDARAGVAALPGDEPGNKNPGLHSRRRCRIKHGAVSTLTRVCRRHARCSEIPKDSDTQWRASTTLPLPFVSLPLTIFLPPSVIRRLAFSLRADELYAHGKFPPPLAEGTGDREDGKWIFTRAAGYTVCRMRAIKGTSSYGLVLIKLLSIAVAIAKELSKGKRGRGEGGGGRRARRKRPSSNNE